MNWRYSIIGIALLCSSQSTAATLSYTQVMQQLNSLLSQKQYQQAYVLADDHMFEYGGSPEFDLLTGFSAYGSEQFQEAVFAFERVVLEQPSSYLGRFYLAQSYHKVDNTAAAIVELETLLLRPLTPEQRDGAQKLLRRLDRQQINKNKKWFQQISTSFAFDDNVNSGTNAEAVNIPGLGEIPLFPSSQKTTDMSYSVNYSASYQHPISQYQWFRLDLSLGHVDFIQFNQYRRNPMSLGLTYESNHNFGKLSGSVYTRPLWLEGQDYRTENGGELKWQFGLNKRVDIGATINFGLVTNANDKKLDFTRNKAAITTSFKSSVLHAAIVQYTSDVSDNPLFEFNDKNSTAFMYQLTVPINDVLISNHLIMVEQQQYQAAHPLFLVQRDEQLTMLSNQLLFSYSDKLVMKLHLNVQQKTSNLDLYSFDRMELGATWQYRL